MSKSSIDFQQQFKRIDNILRTDSGVSTAIDYIEQTSWILFLKYIDDLEKNRKIEAGLVGKKYKEILNEPYRFSVWATPKNDKGEIDYNKRRVNDDLIDFVNQELFPYLKKFSVTTENANTIEYKIGEVFGQLKNRLESGKNLADILDVVDKMEFTTAEAKHEMSALYEDRIAQMGNAGRNGGEYYTPRPLIKTIVKVVDPQINETVYDGAVGSAGFLVEAFEYMKSGKKLTPKQHKILQNETFFGKELKSLAYVIAIMNMVLHGVEAPNIVHGNTLAENVLDMTEKDRVNVILANPPFGAKGNNDVQDNFPVRTGASELMFMQHFMSKLKVHGRAGIVIKNTFLSNGGAGSAEAQIRKNLLEKFNVHTILELPSKVFQAGVKTVVLFFTKGEATRKIWYYQMNLDRNLGKTNPLNENDLAEFLKLQPKKADSENSWTVDIADIDTETYDLSVKNPNKKDEEELRDPKDILKEIEGLDKEGMKVLKEVKKIV